MRTMKKIILDTDVGVDCDDAAALGLLLNAQNAGKCQILGITASTARPGATATIQTICEYYGVNGIPVARLRKPLNCDAMNNYALAVQQKYGKPDTDREAVDLLREILAAQDEKVTLIAIGPLTNISNLLQSGADAYSPLDGESLVREKVEAMYLMGGAFADNYPDCKDKPETVMSEWNILQDVSAAMYVAAHSPCKMLYSPHELGANVFTIMGDVENPVWYSFLSFAKNNNESYENGFKRQSWDPLTCWVALDEENPVFRYSDWGDISVNEKGQTVFAPCENGKCRYMLRNGNLKKMEQLLNQFIEKR